MMRARIAGSIVFVATATMLCFQLFAVAGSPQGATAMQSRLVVQQFDPLNVLVTPYDSSVHSAFADLLSRPESSHIADVAVVVANRSSRAIDGLVLQWIVRNEETGQDVPNTIPIDRFIRDNGEAIVYQGAQVLVTPTGYITDAQTSGHFITSALMSKRVVDKWLATKAPVRVVLDSVIWDDGAVDGPDTFRIIEWVRTRHSVAREIASAVQEHRGNPAAIEKVLSRMVQAAGKARSPYDQRAHWTRRLVASAQRDDQFVFRVAAVPEPSLRRNK
jgi:hypothetical protein